MEKYEIIKYKHDELELDINVSFDSQNVWLTIGQISLLFGRNRTVISRHISNIIKDKENSLNADSVCAKNATTQSIVEESSITASDGKKYKTKLYSLEIVLEIGQRVRSQNGLLLKDFVDNYFAEQFKKDNDIIIYNNGNINLSVTVSPKEETVWLTVDQMSLLFDRDRTVILKHIDNIYKEGELDMVPTCAKNAQVQIEGGRKVKRETDIYNLDVIISVGYRVKSKNGVAFRKWASNILKQYLLKGYAISPERALITKENYEDLLCDVHNLKKDVNEIKEVLGEKVANPYICYEGQYYDGFAFINDLIKSAKKSVVIVDGYADDTVFKFFKGSEKEIKKTIICHKADRISQESLDTFIKQYGGVSILENKSFHDRFLVIDSDVYMIGSSLNSIGNKTTVVIKVQDFVPDDLLQTKTQP